MPGAEGEFVFRRKTDRTAFLWAVPAAKERGDRGRWNYPSQATAAFEMVLSPGAGIASAAGVQSPLRAPQRQGQPATNRDKPPLGTWFAPCISAASGSVPGMQGAEPLA